ncbi:MAG: hypothetical protein EOM91_07245 [Sphingobacteriia bacterium]|nr:hypothetical protein [Sphingobacteriia bacterium]NCC40673.1 hypothetical protein [Gammaproteobacteria bacterium]
MRQPPKTSSATSIILLLVIQSMIGGCATIERDRQMVALDMATRGYQAALRWGDYERAFNQLQPSQREQKGLPPAFANLRVVGYDLVQRPVMHADGSAVQTVVIDYVFEDTQIARRLTDRQTWHWDEVNRTWWLHSGLPAFAATGPR